MVLKKILQLWEIQEMLFLIKNTLLSKITPSLQREDGGCAVKNGFSFVEILMATTALAVLMLGFSQFTADIFSVSASHANQIRTVNDARFATERVITQISRAAYIYPAGITISLDGEAFISTSSSVAMLIPDSGGNYVFVAYYSIDADNGKADLFEFMSDDTYDWAKNTCPASDMTYFSGKSSIIARDINKNSTTLQYVVDYQNSVYDPILKGEISGVDQSNQSALIKGVDWRISQGTSNLQVIQIKGISKNVPRFFE